jgi:hypothetical protein
MDQEMDGFATGLSKTITRDGQSTVTQDIPFNNRKITGLGNATADSDALNRITADTRNLTRFVRYDDDQTLTDGQQLQLRDNIGALAKLQPREDVASATTTDIGAAASQYVRITGTTTITGLGTADAGVVRDVLFGGALTLTHNATSLILPSEANITTAAGDTALFRSEGSGNWRCVRYQRADGKAVVPTGVVAVTTDEYRTHTTWTAGFPINDAKPAITGGAQIHSVAYTMKNAANSLIIEWAGQGAVGTTIARVITAALFRNGEANSEHSVGVQTAVIDQMIPIVLPPYKWTPGSVGPHTIAIRVGPNGDTMALNGNSSARFGGGSRAAVLRITEVQG